MKQTDHYLIVKGKAGLGNRILVLLDSLIYAELSGRKVVIDWRDGAYAPIGINAFPELFSSPQSGDFCILDSVESVVPATWKGHVNKSVDELFALNFPCNSEMDCVTKVAKNYTIETKNLSYNEIVAVRWGWSHDISCQRPFFTGPFIRYASMSDEQVLRTMLKSKVCLADDIRMKVDDFASYKFNAPTIGLHIRYTDRKNSYKEYFTRVNHFFKLHPDGAVFLATDNREVEDDIRSRYPRVYTNVKWYPPQGCPIHRTKSPERDAIRSAKDALIDLYLLGECDTLIYNSMSTFGYLASLISSASKDKLIDMAPWNWKKYLKQIYKKLLIWRK